MALIGVCEVKVDLFKGPFENFWFFGFGRGRIRGSVVVVVAVVVGAVVVTTVVVAVVVGAVVGGVMVGVVVVIGVVVVVVVVGDVTGGVVGVVLGVRLGALFGSGEPAGRGVMGRIVDTVGVRITVTDAARSGSVDGGAGLVTIGFSTFFCLAAHSLWITLTTSAIRKTSVMVEKEIIRGNLKADRAFNGPRGTLK